jgi:sugar phosphate isomerase/epimerase
VNTDGLAINLATVREQFGFREAVDACLRHGIAAVGPWRDQVEKIGLAQAAQIVRDSGVRITGLCRGGMFPAADRTGRLAAIDDNRRAIDTAAALHADCLVLVVGGLPPGSRDVGAARAMVAEGIAAVLPHAREARMPVAIEPMHPMYAADRACVNTLAHANDLCDQLGTGLGIAFDVYHVWWDPDLPRQIARAGSRIITYHVCDWLVPTRDVLVSHSYQRGAPPQWWAQSLASL